MDRQLTRKSRTENSDKRQWLQTPKLQLEAQKTLLTLIKATLKRAWPQLFFWLTLWAVRSQHMMLFSSYELCQHPPPTPPRTHMLSLISFFLHQGYSIHLLTSRLVRLNYSIPQCLLKGTGLVISCPRSSWSEDNLTPQSRNWEIV